MSKVLNHFEYSWYGPDPGLEHRYSLLSLRYPPEKSKNLAKLDETADENGEATNAIISFLDWRERACTISSSAIHSTSIFFNKGA